VQAKLNTARKSFKINSNWTQKLQDGAGAVVWWTSIVSA